MMMPEPEIAVRDKSDRNKDDRNKDDRNKRSGKMASIREVARLARVAPSTVSRALNGSGYVAEETKEKIREAVDELDYVPNQWIRNLYQQKTGIIGVMAPEIVHPYFSSLWSFLELELNKYGYNMMLCNTSGKKDIERQYLDTLERNLFDGMIVGAAFLPDKYYEQIQKPILSLDRIIPGIPLVTSDHTQGGLIAADKMLEKGCKKVLNLIDPQAKTVASSRGGLNFIRKMQEAGAEVITEEFLWDDVIHYPRSIQRTREILAEYPDLDGIMANDLCASSFLKTARELNIQVPQQLKIIAYDGTYITDFNYRTIASIQQDVALIAKEAVQVLVKLINGQPLANDAVYVPVSYIEGDTI